MTTIPAPTLPLLVSTDANEWIHYSTEPRVDDLDIQLEEGYEVKAVDALHFAIGTKWVEFCEGSMHKEYIHKYKLVNFADLKLLEISTRTVTHLLPLPLTSWGINWAAIKARGYDGVYVYHDDLYYHNKKAVPGGYTRWQTFAHCFDIDTLVIWRGAKLQQLINDWPPLTDDQKESKAKEEADSAKYRKKHEDKMAAMTDEERTTYIAEQKKLNRRSFEMRRDKNTREVEWMRGLFQGYDESYPCKPPNCTTPWPQAFEDK